MKKALYVLVPFLAALAIRIAPTLITGVPFHVDSWDQIRQTELLLQHTPTPLNSIFFDGYNNFWPITSIFGTITSQVTALPPITSLAVWIPIAAALTIPIFYTLIKKLTESSQVALIASALLSVAFPYALFTAGITKETFANPIYIALILVFLLKHNWKTALLFFCRISSTGFNSSLNSILCCSSLSKHNCCITPKQKQKQKLYQNKPNIHSHHYSSHCTIPFSLRSRPPRRLQHHTKRTTNCRRIPNLHHSSSHIFSYILQKRKVTTHHNL